MNSYPYATQSTAQHETDTGPREESSSSQWSGTHSVGLPEPSVDRYSGHTWQRSDPERYAIATTPKLHTPISGITLAPIHEQQNNVNSQPSYQDTNVFRSGQRTELMSSLENTNDGAYLHPDSTRPPPGQAYYTGTYLCGPGPDTVANAHSTGLDPNALVLSSNQSEATMLVEGSKGVTQSNWSRRPTNVNEWVIEQNPRRSGAIGLITVYNATTRHLSTIDWAPPADGIQLKWDPADDNAPHLASDWMEMPSRKPGKIPENGAYATYARQIEIDLDESLVSPIKRWGVVKAMRFPGSVANSIMPIFKRYSAGTGVQNRPTFAETLCGIQVTFPGSIELNIKTAIGLPLIAQGRTTIQMSIVRPESKYLPDDDEAGRSSSSRPSKDKGKAASGTSSSVKKGNHHRKGHGHGHGKKTEKG